jgi:hypothetical protein
MKKRNPVMISLLALVMMLSIIMAPATAQTGVEFDADGPNYVTDLNASFFAAYKPPAGWAKIWVQIPYSLTGGGPMLRVYHYENVQTTVLDESGRPVVGWELKEYASDLASGIYIVPAGRLIRLQFVSTSPSYSFKYGTVKIASTVTMKPNPLYGVNTSARYGFYPNAPITVVGYYGAK